MHLTRRIWIQIGVFTLVSITAGAFVVFNYMKLPSLLFGVGRYEVTLQLPASGGLYERSNVTYRGVEVGHVESVRLDGTGVAAVLELRSDIEIPSALTAEVHSVSAVGEQYVTLLPTHESPPLKDGDVITVEQASVPPPIDALVDATNRGLEAIPGDNLRTAIDEAYVAFGGLGPEFARLVDGSTKLAIGAGENLDAITTLVDKSAPVLQTQIDTSDSVQAWAAHIANITDQLRQRDTAVRGILHTGPPMAAQTRALFDRLKPSLPVLLANLVGLGEVAVTYRDGIEQLLVLLPQGTAMMQATGVANHNVKMDYRGSFLSFNLNMNLPPPCTTGYLPAQQMRVPSEVDYPERPPGDLYCRIPQDAPFNVRGARNTPCVTRPGKRAPTVEMCESDQQYVPLNDGMNWKGDPNATLSGQDIPQLDPAPAPAPEPAPSPAPAAPVAVAEYDPQTGSYVGPDGKVYTQANLGRPAAEGQTWQSMLVPPTP